MAKKKNQICVVNKTLTDKKLKVIIVDDNKNIRESVSLLLQDTPSLQLVAAYDSGVECIKNLEEVMPDIILMDIDMPKMSGIETVKIIRNSFPGLPILMLTGFEDDDKVFDSICAGANGYILKNASMELLINQIHEAYLGGAPMTPVIARKVLNMFSASFVNHLENENYNLSKREKEVLELLVNGKSYKVIATELAISYETVHSHIKKIYHKLHVSSIGEAVSKTIKQKILGK
ncbi:MAG TPA: response regulator transcription factor [Bacteroidia bacterium]|nr:response regulator transcription factor [Bacteroidia bacterium]HMU19374.1 response regulator transcription factor [Bacteroidia bacterium]